MNDSQFEALLKEAVCEYHIEELKAIPSNRELKAAYTLSPEFYRKMDKILTVQNKAMRKHNIVRIIKYAATIMLMIGTITLINEDVRAKIKEIFFEIFEEYGVMTFNSDGENLISSLEDIEFKLGYVPDGYELKDEFNDANMKNVLYINVDNNEDELFVICSLIFNEVSEIKSDSEEMTYETITINNKFDGYYISSGNNNKENSLIFYNNEVGCSVTIMANLSKEVLIKVAENIEY